MIIEVQGKPVEAKGGKVLTDAVGMDIGKRIELKLRRKGILSNNSIISTTLITAPER